MKKFAILSMLALELAVLGCANNTPNQELHTITNATWEATLSGGLAQASLMNFTTTFQVEDAGPLDITAFSFFNSGACFGTNITDHDEAGTATLTVNSLNQVTGTLTYTITSRLNGNVLTLTSPSGDLTGNSNGAPGVLGTLSNGVAIGTWTLTSADPTCIPNSPVSGTFLMCQGATTCTPPQ
jgi:hypothetical protein